MTSAVPRLALVLLPLVILLACTPAFGQLTKIDNKLPRIVPLKVEFKNYDKVNWWHDFEIEVTNTGKTPIYYLDLVLWLDAEYVENAKQMAIGFEFGDIRRFFSSTNGEVASPGDPAILPGKSYTFKVPDNYVKGWDMAKQTGSFVEPRNAELTHGWTNFGDGTGLLPGGTPWRTPKKKRI